MNCVSIEPLLDALVDGESSDAERGEAERHLAGCADCRRALEELHELRRGTAALPRELRPTRDLLPGIRSATEPSRPGRPGAAWTRWAALAASLLVAVTVGWVGWQFWPESTERVAEGPAGSAAIPVADAARADFQAAEMQYLEASALLLETLDERSGELSPQTRAIVEENLRVIDAAIDEVRAALESEPDNLHNGHVLTALYQQKVQFLWMVSRLSS